MKDINETLIADIKELKAVINENCNNWDLKLSECNDHKDVEAEE